MKTALKKILLCSLPEPLLRPIKKYFYAYSLKDVSSHDLRDGPVVHHLLRKGDHAMDVGANIGYFTKVMAEIVGTEGYVYAFEPVPQTYSILKSNLIKWKRANTKTLERAVSDADTMVTMEIPPFEIGGDDFYAARITKGSPNGKQRKYAQVKTIALDKLERSPSHPINFIKMDAMGNELKCIKGAAHLLKEDHPALLIAIYSEPNNPKSEAAQLFKILQEEHDYSIYWYNGDKLKEWEPGETSYRYFFLYPEHVDRLKDKGVL